MPGVLYLLGDEQAWSAAGTALDARPPRCNTHQWNMRGGAPLQSNAGEVIACHTLETRTNMWFREDAKGLRKS
jgi:hypothetical protein